MTPTTSPPPRKQKTGWSGKQKSLAAQACAAIGWGDTERHLVLRQFRRAFFDAWGRPCAEPTSKSSRLTDADYEQFMAIVEHAAGGQIVIRGRPRWGRGYWQGKAKDVAHRLRFKASSINDRLCAAAASGHVRWGDKSLQGWVAGEITHDDGVYAKSVDDCLWGLTHDQLYALVEGLKAFARRHKVRV